jgi:hypothetical protein
MLDHVVLAAPDLDRAVAEFAARTGVEPARGGSHSGLGTANYLVGLGAAAYLEIIGPDAGQPAPAHERWFLVDRLHLPRIVTWALRVPDLDTAVAAARARGYDPGDPRAMSRESLTGDLLQWRLTPPRPEYESGLVPFLIDWGATEHPTARSLPRVEPGSFTATHPDPARIGRMLTALGASLRIDAGDTAALILTVETPRGEVVLS